MYIFEYSSVLHIKIIPPPVISQVSYIPLYIYISFCISGSGPHVSVLSEYDALPEIGHACGHNLIAEVGVGAGLGIKAAIDAAKKEGKDIGQVCIYK